MHSTEIDPPPEGTPEREAWRHGAAAEAACRVEGMTDKARELYELVEILGQQGRSPDEIVRSVAFVFTCEWALRRRLALAWELLRGPRLSRHWTVYREPRDWWIGYYRGDRYHYVCPLPTIVVRWDRRIRR